jgi:mono/diheme cytochrome c family protein
MSGSAAMASKAVLAAFLVVSAAPALAAGDTLDGKELFRTRCGMCHQTNGMGVGLLSRRPADASKGLLEAREDISATLVKVVVRHGIGNMPRVPRGEVADPELETIALYLSRGKP